MLVRDILCDCSVLGKLKLPKSYTDDGADEPTDDETAVKLLKCLNYVLDELETEYFPVYREEEVFAKNNVIDLYELTNKLSEAVKLTDEHGGRVKFSYSGDKLVTAKNGKMRLKYTTRSERKGFFGEVVLCASKLTERSIAYGVLAEYFFLFDDFETSAVWDARYKTALANAFLSHRERKLPPRRWSL